MASQSDISPEMIRAAMVELMLAASPFIRSCQTKPQANLIAAINTCREVLKGESDHPVNSLDPDVLLQQYIYAGGNWREMVNAVNRNALHGATFQIPEIEDNQNEQEKGQ